MTEFAWTESAVEKLKEFLADGMTCSQIARHLGCSSRNAVISKIHRMNLRALRPARPKPLANVRAPTAKPVVVSKSAKAVTVPLLLPVNHLGPKEETLTIAHLPRSLTLVDLRRGDCRFPLWDHQARLPVDQQFYCGVPGPEGSSWCAYHRTIVFTDSARRA